MSRHLCPVSAFLSLSQRQRRLVAPGASCGLCLFQDMDCAAPGLLSTLDVGISVGIDARVLNLNLTITDSYDLNLVPLLAPSIFATRRDDDQAYRRDPVAACVRYSAE